MTGSSTESEICVAWSSSVRSDLSDGCLVLTVPAQAKAQLWIASSLDELGFHSDASTVRTYPVSALTQPIEIRVEAGAQLECFENLSLGLAANLGAASKALSIRFIQAPQSHVRRVRISNSALNTLGPVTASLKRDSGFRSVQIQASRSEQRTEDSIEVQLTEPGAETILSGIAMGSDQSKVATHSKVEHLSGQTRSRQLYKALMGGRSRSAFVGEVRIHPHAVGADAGQMHRSYLLDPKAESSSRPVLEIECDDVKAAHGAAIGQLDPEHVFYLMSRGIPRERATEMLSEGFALEVLGVLDGLDVSSDFRAAALSAVLGSVKNLSQAASSGGGYGVGAN